MIYFPDCGFCGYEMFVVQYVALGFLKQLNGIDCLFYVKGLIT